MIKFFKKKLCFRYQSKKQHGFYVIDFGFIKIMWPKPKFPNPPNWNSEGC